LGKLKKLYFTFRVEIFHRGKKAPTGYSTLTGEKVKMKKEEARGNMYIVQCTCEIVRTPKAAP
jgi:hypothetical protein